MIHVVATVELAEGKRDDFLKRVQQLVPEVRAEKAAALNTGRRSILQPE